MSKEQKKAEQERIQNQIESLHQQILQEQQRKREEKEKEKEAASEGSQQPVQAASKAGQAQKAQPVMEDQSVHGLIKANTSISRAENLDKVEISLEGRARVLERQIEWDGQVMASSGGSLEINREELSSLNRRLTDVRAAKGETLGELNGVENEQESNRTQAADKENGPQGKETNEPEKAEEKLDTFA